MTSKQQQQQQQLSSSTAVGGKPTVVRPAFAAHAAKAAAAAKAARVERVLSQHPNKMLMALCPKNHQPKDTTVPAALHKDEHVDNYTHRVVTAVRDDNLTELETLLTEEEQCFEACNSNGEYLIHLAARRGELSTIQFLVEKARVNVNVQDDQGRTVFHDVCWRPKATLAIFEYFMKHCNPWLLMEKDARGHTPFDYSRDQEWPQWNKLLLQHRHYLHQRLSEAAGMIAKTTMNESESKATTSAPVSATTASSVAVQQTPLQATDN